MKHMQCAIWTVLLSCFMATTYAQESTEVIFYKSHEPKKQNAPICHV